MLDPLLVAQVRLAEIGLALELEHTLGVVIDLDGFEGPDLDGLGHSESSARYSSEEGMARADTAWSIGEIRTSGRSLLRSRARP